jgi:hypothetical protein
VIIRKINLNLVPKSKAVVALAGIIKDRYDTDIQNKKEDFL